MSREESVQLLQGAGKSLKFGFQRTGVGFGHKPVLGGQSVVGGRGHEEFRALREATGYSIGEEIQGFKH